jgi:hypothetical protein
MELYTILGLNVIERIGHSYETDSRGRILDDADGNAMTKQRKFTDYIIYAYSGEVYYAIHLRESDGASFGGHLYTMAYMHIEVLDNPPTHFTHSPIRPLCVYTNFEVRKYDFDEEVDVYLYDDPEKRLFRFSGLGSGDERIPYGYVLVNMDCFWKRDKNEFVSKL